MNTEKILDSLQKHWSQKIPFVLFSMPNSNIVTSFIQNNAALFSCEKFTESAFIFAPFLFNGKALCIPERESKVDKFIVFPSENDLNTLPIATQDEKSTHIALVSSILNEIKSKRVLKVVASRKKEIPLKNFTIIELVKSVFANHSTTFRYVWYHPETGLWCGATPELLFQSDGESFCTMALAGTQKEVAGSEPHWNAKEITEQEIVTEAIVNDLQKITAVIKTTKPISYKAGSLYHIKTEITGIIKNSRSSLPKVANALHPTPAVCGMPKKTAKKIIESLENYEREFYTGFLGPVFKKDNCAAIFVNLRCMKVEDNKASIYVGGGITADSEPESEWEETQNKLATMYQVLQPLL
jgi:isochorismate synthase